MPLNPDQLQQLREAPANDAGNRVQTALDLLGLTQTGAAEQMGKKQSFVSDLVRGRWTPKLDTCHEFAEFLGCTVDDLFPAPSKSVAADEVKAS